MGRVSLTNQLRERLCERALLQPIVAKFADLALQEKYQNLPLEIENTITSRLTRCKVRIYREAMAASERELSSKGPVKGILKKGGGKTKKGVGISVPQDG